MPMNQISKGAKVEMVKISSFLSASPNSPVSLSECSHGCWFPPSFSRLESLQKDSPLRMPEDYSQPHRWFDIHISWYFLFN